MGFEFRRVVTGHDVQGHAVVKQDATVVAGERLPGYFASTVWCTGEFPVNNDEGHDDAGAAAPKGGRVLMRIGEMRADAPASHGMHRTESLDYAVILSGECDMRLDGGDTVRRLRAGDVVIQRGTNHAWVPVGPEPCRLLFVLIDAHPVRGDGFELRDDVSSFQGMIHPMGASADAT